MKKANTPQGRIVAGRGFGQCLDPSSYCQQLTEYAMWGVALTYVAGVSMSRRTSHPMRPTQHTSVNTLVYISGLQNILEARMLEKNDIGFMDNLVELKGPPSCVAAWGRIRAVLTECKPKTPTNTRRDAIALLSEAKNLICTCGLDSGAGVDLINRINAVVAQQHP